MSNNIEIQREAIIEIVGTQYENRAENHKNLIYHQNLTLQHQSNNILDPNAVVVLTEDGKELGLLPKDQAFLYAPAIDSRKYSFTVEVIKAEYDLEKPVLVVKIISDSDDYVEERIEKNVLEFVQEIVNGYTQERKEYLKYIYSETVNIDELLSVLNKARLIQKLHSHCIDIIKSHGMEQTSEKYTHLTGDIDELTKYLDNLRSEVDITLRKIQKEYNESFDIDDDIKYYEVQNETRERRKKFRSYNNLLDSLLDSAKNYKNISVAPAATLSNLGSTTESEPTPESKSEQTSSENGRLTEKAFFDRLVDVSNISNTTANQYISSIHSVERLYQNIFKVKENILGAASVEKAKTIIEAIVQRDEYIDNNAFRAPLKKFAEFANIYIEELNGLSAKKNYRRPNETGSYIIKTVDFNHPHDCTYCKPYCFRINGVENSVTSWRELYTKFLMSLYNNNNYVEILKGLNGKSLFGGRIDFADNVNFYKLCNAVRVSTDFFAEGNLSAVDIIKRIKRLMELCSIRNEDLIIKYIAQEQDDQTVLTDDDHEQSTALNTQVSAKTIIEVIKENSDHLQYEDGFGVYDIKSLLSYKGITEVSEEYIQAVMSKCSELQEVEEGYYSLIRDKKPDGTPQEQTVFDNRLPTIEPEVVIEKTMDVPPSSADTGNVVLRLGGKTVIAYDCSDALSKICEFSINCKPFEMARITEQKIQLRGNNAFYRNVSYIDGYKRLSNGLQLITINTFFDLQALTTEIKKYCQLDDNMITIINQ